jgi:hypothetical protein
VKMDRRKLLALLGLSPTLLADSPARAQQAKKAAPHSAAGTVVGLNPRGTPPPIKLVPMAPRLDSLDGKTVYLVDVGFHDGDNFLRQMQAWFQQNMPGVTTVFKRKAGAYAEDDPKLWEEIKAKGQAMVMAIGH